MAKAKVKTRLAPGAPWPVYETPPPEKVKKKKAPKIVPTRPETKADQTNKKFAEWLAKQH